MKLFQFYREGYRAFEKEVTTAVTIVVDCDLESALRQFMEFRGTSVTNLWQLEPSRRPESFAAGMFNPTPERKQYVWEEFIRTQRGRCSFEPRWVLHEVVPCDRWNYLGLSGLFASDNAFWLVGAEDIKKGVVFSHTEKAIG